MGRMHDFRLSVSVSLSQNCIGAVFFYDSFYLAGDDVYSFIPGDSLELALAPVLRVSIALGVPINPF